MKFDAINANTARRKEYKDTADIIISQSAVLEERMSVSIDSLLDYTDEYGDTQPYDIDEEKVEALAASMKENGQLEPIVVRELKDGKYQILAGHHRIRACRKCGFKTADIKIIECSDWQAYRIVVESNTHHGNPKPSQIAKILISYKTHSNESGEKVTNEMLARIFDISESEFYRYIKLATLTDELIEDVDNGLLSTNSVKEVAKLSKTQQRTLSEYIEQSEKALNVAGCKKAISFLSENPNADVNELYSFMSAKKSKKKYKNEIFNTLTENESMAAKLSEHSEDELTKLVTKLLIEHFEGLENECK
jgi:ParB family chromosome partitioning protein